MQEKIEILDVDLVSNHREKLKLIEYWATVLNYPMGWHYWLDFIWILNHLEEVGLPKGSWIMDAGAGNGVLQFILASLGYNIISLDFAERDIPWLAKMIFDIQEQRYHINNFNHHYRKFIKHKKGKFNWSAKNIAKNIIYEFIPSYINFGMWKEVFKSGIKRNSYGKIIYTLGDFTNLEGFKDKSVDCIISVSALEHADHEDINKAVREFERILKKYGFMLLTVSAAKDKDWYFKPARGWCFCEDSLKKIFILGESFSNFVKYEELFKKLENSKEIKNRISRYYLGTADCGLPYGIYEPKYQPVGIVKQKGS